MSVSGLQVQSTTKLLMSISGLQVQSTTKLLILSVVSKFKVQLSY